MKLHTGNLNLLCSSYLMLLILIQISVCKRQDQRDSWILNIFKECTIHILGIPRDFSTKAATYGNQNPIIIDVYHYPFNHGRYNRTKLMQTSNNDEVTVLARFRPKFTSCVVQSFFLLSCHPQLLMSSMHNLVHALVLSNENPNFIIFMFRHLFNFDTRVLANGMNSVSLTSIPLVSIEVSRSIELLCLTCSNPSENVIGDLLKLNLDTKQALECQVKELSRNLRRRVVIFEMRLYPPSATCSLYHQWLATSSSSCTASNLASRYNFTYANMVHPMLLVTSLGSVYNGAAMSRTGIQNEFIDAVKRENVKNIWLPHGCIYRPYKYVTFMSKEDAVNFLSIFQPFDLSIAALLLVCTVAVIITSIIILLNFTQIMFKNYTLVQIIGMAAFYPFKSVLEQDDTILIKFSRNTLSGYFLISTWLFMCNVIGNEYKGAMYSSMTSSPIQPVPKSMIDLVMFSDMPYYTTTKHFYEGKYYSTMKDMVLADMIYTGEENFMTRFLFRFRHRLCLLYGSESDIIFNITRKLSVHSEHGWQMISKKFALVSTEEDADLFVGVMKKLTNFYIIPNNKVSPFVSRVPWYGKRNQFITIFSTALSRLVQSGIYDRWNEHYHKSKLIRKLMEVDRRLNITVTSYYALVVLADSKLANQNLDGSPVTWASVDLIFLGCGILLVGSILVSILELILGKLLHVEKTTPVVQYFEFIS